MIETKRIKMYPASREQMEKIINLIKYIIIDAIILIAQIPGKTYDKHISWILNPKKRNTPITSKEVNIEILDILYDKDFMDWMIDSVSELWGEGFEVT